MTGRQEKTAIEENKILEKLERQPLILRRYYNSLESKTAQTKKVYINYLISYFDYLMTHGVNPNLPNSFKKVNKMDIDDYMAYIRYRKDKNGNIIENGESIRRSKMFAIIDFYDFLIDNEIITKNPCERIKLPKLKNDIKVVSLTKDEIETIKNRILSSNSKTKERDIAIFILGIRTGLRIESIIEINLEDIDFNEKCITVIEKGNKKRNVYFGEDTENVIKTWIEKRGDAYDTNALFVSSRGKRMSYHVPKYLFEKYAYGFDKNITPHKTRSTCGTTTYEKTGDIYLVAEILGHSNIANTRRYANVSDKRRKEAASLLDSL